MSEEVKKEAEKEAEVIDGENKQEAVDYKAKAEELEAEIKKLKDKETNFGKLKEMTEAEKKKHNEEKQTLQQQVDALKEQVAASEKQKVEELRDATIHAVVGGDEDKVKAIKAEYDLLNMPATTREEIVARTKKAVRLAGFELEGDTSNLSFGSGREPERKEKKFSDTDKGKQVFNTMFPDLVKK